MKKISIVMGVYNEKKEELCQAIDSILNQTYQNFEFIIILDSPENIELLMILKKYETLNKKIKLIVNKKNMGLPKSLNRGIEEATGDYIARMDADDIAMPNRLKKQVEYLERFSDIALLGTDAIKINDSGEIIGEIVEPIGAENIKRILKYRSCLIHPSIIFKKEILLTVGGYRNFPCAQDYDLYSRLTDSGYKIENLKEKLMKYRVRGNSISTEKRLFQILMAEYIRKLSKERSENNGKDSFSEDEILKIEEIYKKENKNFQKINKLVLKIKDNKILLTLFLPWIYIRSKYYRKEIHNRIKILLNKFWR